MQLEWYQMDYRFLVRDEVSSVVVALLLYRVLINRGNSTAFYNVFLSDVLAIKY